MTEQQPDGFASLDGHVAIVTGGGQGIGRAIALKLAAGGASVAIIDANVTTASEVAGQIAELGVRSLALCADCSDDQQVDRAMSEVEAELGAIDVLVNNAAVQGLELARPFWEEDVQLHRNVLELNLMLMALPTRRALQSMVERHSGAIVSIASEAGRAGERGEAMYGSAKAGVIGLTRGLAKSVGPLGVRINTVSPGATMTPYADRVLKEGQADKMSRAYPLRRLGQPDDIASAVRFLASNEAAWITGQTLGVNGGYLMP